MTKSDGLAKHFIITERWIGWVLRQMNACSHQSWYAETNLCGQNIITKQVYVKKCCNCPENQQDSESQKWDLDCVLLIDYNCPFEKGTRGLSRGVLHHLWKLGQSWPTKHFLYFLSGTEMFSDLNALVTWFEFQSPSKTNMTFYDYFK